MSIAVIRATFECDGCGAQFRVEMDPADTVPKGWALDELAIDCLRGGQGADGTMPGIVHDMHLCAKCMEIAASVGPADEPQYAPREEIMEAFDKAALRKKVLK